MFISKDVETVVEHWMRLASFLLNNLVSFGHQNLVIGKSVRTRGPRLALPLVTEPRLSIAFWSLGSVHKTTAFPKFCVAFDRTQAVFVLLDSWICLPMYLASGSLRYLVPLTTVPTSRILLETFWLDPRITLALH